MTRKELKAIVAAIIKLRDSATDEQAFASFEAFPAWKVGVTYAEGYRVKYNDKLYKSLLEHTSSEGYTPDITNYQWVEITDPSIEWPDWVQPVGYADAYANGAKVTHNGKKWTSNCDNNTWEPGVYGWDEVTERVGLNAY